MPLSITIADYGVGNLFSIKRSLENCGADVRVTSDMSELLDAECIVFPGVGAFDKTMERLQPYREEIRDRADDGIPMLGICIGMQIMYDRSAEGSTPGLGIIPGEVVPVAAKVVPHMGWNTVESDDSLMEGVEDRHFYFVHSYHGSPVSKECIKGVTEYEGREVPAYFRTSNVCGTQFHPEKSSASGMAFLTNFIAFAEGCL